MKAGIAYVGKGRDFKKKKKYKIGTDIILIY